MNLAEAALIFAAQSTDRTAHFKYDHAVMTETVAAIVEETQDVQEVATLIAIARWESGAWRRDVASCKIRGDSGAARGIFQVHPLNDQEKQDTCSSDYKKQVDVALFHIRDSIAVCKMHGYRGSALITVYTHGTCRTSDEVSRSHWGNGAALRKILYTEDNITLSKNGVIVCASGLIAKE